MKGHLDVIETVYEIYPNHPDLKQYVATTPYNTAVSNTASDNIIWLLQKGAYKYEPLADLPSSDETIELKRSLASILLLDILINPKASSTIA